MHKTATRLLAAALCLVSAVALASDYQTPNLFTAGEVISADSLNENFEQLAAVMRPVLADDLLGRWHCASFVNNNASTLCSSEWKPEGQFFASLSETVAFSQPTPGNYQLTTEGKDIFSCANSSALSTSFEVRAGALFYHYTVDLAGYDKTPYVGGYNLRRQSTTQVRWDYVAGGSFNPLFIVCDKLDLPPARPSSLRADPSGSNVVLTWADNSTDETAFVVLRRDSLTGTFREIATTKANVPSYTDPDLAMGTYWYRIKARNGFGDSFGTNLVRVAPAADAADAGGTD